MPIFTLIAGETSSGALVNKMVLLDRLVRWVSNLYAINRLHADQGFKIVRIKFGATMCLYF